MAAIVALLAKSIGPMLAKAVIDKLLSSKGGPSKIQRVADATEKGTSVIAALRGEFGDDFLKAITDSFGTLKDHKWSYEAGCSDYIKVDPDSTGLAALTALRDELNVNLDRLALMENLPDEVLLNYFRGTLGTWKRRYLDIFGPHKEASDMFATMDDLLDGNTRTFRDVLEKISKTSIGGVGALMVISGVLLASGVGVGLATSISIFLFGIPWLSVGALVIPGAIMIGLTRYKFTNKHAMSACVKMAYKLLEERAKVLNVDSTSINPGEA